MTPDEENFGLQPREKRKLEDFLGVNTEYVAFSALGQSQAYSDERNITAWAAKMEYHKLHDHDA